MRGEKLISLLVKSSKTDKFTVMSRIKFGFSPFKPDRRKYMGGCIFQQFIKIWHGGSNLIPVRTRYHCCCISHKLIQNQIIVFQFDSSNELILMITKLQSLKPTIVMIKPFSPTILDEYHRSCCFFNTSEEFYSSVKQKMNYSLRKYPSFRKCLKKSSSIVSDNTTTQASGCWRRRLSRPRWWRTLYIQGGEFQTIKTLK